MDSDAEVGGYVVRFSFGRLVCVCDRMSVFLNRCQRVYASTFCLSLFMHRLKYRVLAHRVGVPFIFRY